MLLERAPERHLSGLLCWGELFSVSAAFKSFILLPNKLTGSLSVFGALSGMSRHLFMSSKEKFYNREY